MQYLFQPDMYVQKFTGVTKQTDAATFSKLDKQLKVVEDFPRNVQSSTLTRE